MAKIAIPDFPELPRLHHDAVAEITRAVFDEPSATKPCDVIFVFGGTHPGLWRHAASAYHNQLGRDIVVTGGSRPTMNRGGSAGDVRAEALVIRDELIALNVPDRRIHVELRSTNSLENVLFAMEIYGFFRVASVLAICKSYASGRQCRTLRHHVAVPTQVTPHAFDTNVRREGPIVTRENWMTMKRSRSFVFGEFLKILKYGQLGHLEPVSSISDTLHEAVRRWARTNRELR